ncbi:hypothetical protein PTKIN_Ptkin04bG0144000 [Pterospermum kingtungense]
MTVHIEQRAQRDAAIAQLEQSRIILVLRLAEHHGNKYKVIDEVLAFVGAVNDASCFVSSKNLHGTPVSPSGENLVPHEGKCSKILTKFLLSSFNFAKKSMKFDHLGGILSNAALLAISLISMLHLHQIAFTEHPERQEDIINSYRNLRKNSQQKVSSSYDCLSHLDVFLARG